MEVEGIGPERAEAIAEWFRDDDNRAPRRRAARARPPLRDRRGGPAAGGAAHRAAATCHGHARVAHARGGRGRARGAAARRSPTRVSSKTTGVIVGEEPGRSKLTKAEKAGVPLLTEADLLDVLPRAIAARTVANRSWAARGPESTRAAVLEHREDVAVADEAGQRGGVVGRARLRVDDARRGAVPRIRSCSVPVRPATGSAATQLGLAAPGRSTSCGAGRRARRASCRSRSESPEPSTRRTPASGTPACVEQAA